MGSSAMASDLQDAADRLDPELLAMPVDRPSGVEAEVELRLGEERAGQLQDLVGLAKLSYFAFELLHTPGLAGRHAFAHAGIDLSDILPEVVYGRQSDVAPVTWPAASGLDHRTTAA